MKKILCVIDSLNSGGAQRQLVGLARLLSQCGYEVGLLWYYDGFFYYNDIKETDVVLINSISRNKVGKFLRVYQGIKAFKPDTVISYLDLPSMMCCLIKLFNHKFNLIVSERNTTQTLNLREKIKFRLFTIANKVVPNSYTQESFILNNFPKLRNKTTTITNFVDLNKFTPCEERKVGDVLKILCVGRISQQKNVERLLKAVRLAADKGTKFVLSWYGSRRDEDYWKMCESLLNTLGIQNIVTFYEPNQNIVKIYHKYDVLCHPSVFEGTPNVICEAMSCGLPIIASNVCDNSRIVEENRNGFLFDPYSEEDIAKCLNKICNISADKLSEMSVNSREKAEKMFSEVVFIDKYKEIL